MKAYYTDHFVLPLPPDHRFPMTKYSRLRERILAEGVLRGEWLIEPEPATDSDLLRAHTHEYVERVQAGLLTDKEMRRIGFPWTPQMVERSRRSSGATTAACRAALAEGMAVNLAGGTHHAFSDHGEGYCVFNDGPVAARAMQAEGRVKRVVILDCDVHQGNGTASILADDPSIFTFSIHGAKNYPYTKERSDLDIELEDGTTDEPYLETLEKALKQIFPLARADLAIYLAGADPYERDRLGRLKLTKAGLLARDQLVLGMCRAQGIPVAVTMAGGYAREVEDIVDIHLQTVRAALEFSQ
jgi:acetoin utilization deacetylase AcuC-like enzyme